VHNRRSLASPMVIVCVAGGSTAAERGVTGSAPTGGVPLPLVRHGGSAVPTAMLGFGLPIAVRVHRDAELGPARD